MPRKFIKEAKLVVIKIGTKVLLENSGRPNYDHISHLVSQIAHLHNQGIKIVFVTSGAIGAGMEALGLKKRPKDLPTLQACAAIGQLKLMRTYEDLFSNFNCKIAQVLLTSDDLKVRKRHLNIKHTFRTILDKGVIPIVNENDTVSVEEIKFGDNDILASLVAMLLPAKILILLTTAQGFMFSKENGQEERLSHITKIDDKIYSNVKKHEIGLSIGGMKSKLIAAENMSHVGGITIIAPGLDKNVLLDIFDEKDIGTVIGNIKTNEFLTSSKKRWIAFYNKPLGTLVVDEGAKKALKHSGSSLLPIGITQVIGKFDFGTVVEIKDQNGESFARGIVQFGSREISLIMGNESSKIENILGFGHYDEVIHRDNLVLL